MCEHGTVKGSPELPDNSSANAGRSARNNSADGGSSMKRQTWWGVVLCLWLGCGGGGGHAPAPSVKDAGRDGSSGKEGGGNDAVNTTVAVRVLSVPVDDATVGEAVRYRVVP